MTVDLNKLAARRRAVMDAIVIDTPRAREAHQKFEFLYELAKCKDNHSKLLLLPMFADSQSGKTTLIDTFATSKNTPEALEGRKIPVLCVTLEAKATRKTLAVNMLQAIGEFGWETGSHTGVETVLLQRVRQLLFLAGTRVVFFDEAQHAVNSDRETVVYSIGETYKRMLIKGECCIVLSGTEKGRRVFMNEQLLQRSLPAVVLAPLTANNPGDMKLFIQFLAEYLKALEEKGVVQNGTNLIQGDVPACLLEISKGILGATCNLLKEAVRVMTYEGRSELERAHLVEATNAGFIQTGLYGRNPFLHGYAPLKTAA